MPIPTFDYEADDIILPVPIRNFLSCQRTRDFTFLFLKFFDQNLKLGEYEVTSTKSSREVI